jgi:hypothetical protein
MLHAYFTPIALCFVYTSWHFYAFSGTNLLTRCHSASSPFSAIFVFQKSYTGNILRIGRNKIQSSIYLTRRRSPKERRRGARGQPHHRVARATPLPRHQVVWTPGPPPDIAVPPINSLWWENPKGRTLFMKHTASRRHRSEIGRVQKLFSAPCRREKSSPEAFFITMPASEVMCE